ncbi:hypothetical protein FACUT_8323 [Fusarium acutatum]|uniref:PNPLA domain-containing protein n=1 Tax=Fusarium acutatum TaxID=78861 RepID=A0A8H4NGC5_9HYPO|nr:hypothetical protein FACUT_8323 [Fusarium acutatum]
MPLQSKRTVKVHEIPAGTTKQQYRHFVEHLCTKPQTTSKSHFSRVTKHFKRKSKLLVGASTSASTDEVDEYAKSKDEAELAPPPSTAKGEGEQAAPLLDDAQPTAKGWMGTTYCRQNGHLVGTVSFENEILKNEALARHEKDKKCSWGGWTIEDNFKGITTLYEAADAKVDICAVHGLGGNAIDTWTTKSGKMWFRDFLPEHENFKNSRVMTFGYDSDLTDRRTVMELESWAETLLQSLNEVRTGEKNIKLSQCGIVFLATPHSGSTKADWSNFVVATAHTIGGVRPETVKTLESFNTASVWDTAEFLNLDPCPPFRCFAEGRKMRVKGTKQHVGLDKLCSTLGSHPAYMIMDVDHSSICKFESRLGPFTTISMALWKLLNDVTTGGVQQPNARPERRGYGQPRFLAHAYPPDRGFWWEGTELNGVQYQLTSTKPFFGRSAELDTLESSLAGDGTRPSLTVVKGIGGIGKTELLLQFAATQRDRRNVFFLGSQDGETIESVLSKLSTRIGFDMIEDPGENQERWRSTPVAERIQILIAWLGDKCNRESLFIIDDIEAFGYSKIPVILKYPAQHTLISTRDSNLKRADRVFREIRLSPLGNNDTARILQSTLESLSADSGFGDDLCSISRAIQGHPLAARNAIPFAMDYLATYESPSTAFSQLFESQDPEDRRVFLKFSFEGRSLWEAFGASLERLELQENTQNATSLLQILPFLSCDNDCVDDFLKMNKRLSLDCEKALPDMAVLRSGYTVMSNWLSKLRGVSFFLQSDSSNTAKSLNIHPLMLQYMLLHIDEQRRISLMRQLLHLFYNVVSTAAEKEFQIKPHVQHCIRVCRGLGVSLNALDLPEGVLKWVMGLLEEREEIRELEESGEVRQNPFDDPVELLQGSVNDFITLCFGMKAKLQGYGNITSEGSAAYKMISDLAEAEDSPQVISVPEGAMRPSDSLPLEAGVSGWLVDFYDINKQFLNGTKPENYKGHIKYTMEIDGVAYLEVASEGQLDLEVIDERTVARERIAMILQAFPSKNAEIIGEEIIERLMDVVKTSILPLLSSLTEADIEDWLLPTTPKERESFLVSIVEFLYQVTDRLGIENPLIPMPLLGQLSTVIASQTVTKISIVLSRISQVFDAYNGNNALKSSLWSSGAMTDQRSNALIGHILAMLLSNEASTGEPKASAESLAGALSDWVPLSLSKPSTMEYLAATSFCSRMQINSIGKPSFVTVDTIALKGLLLSRRKQHKDGAECLGSTMGAITSQYGPCSMQLGIVTAELANCYNILRKEEKAESCVRTTLDAREGRCLSTRRDGVYLRLALADSLIGRARYNEAVLVLESIIGSPDISATFRMMSVLRLARSRRRMHKDTQRAFEENSPLWTGLPLLSHVSGVLTIEYIEELACNISEIPKQQLRSSKRSQELIEAVDSVMCGSNYLAESPCWEWYTKVQQDYLGEITKDTKKNKGKQKDDGTQTEAGNGLGTPISAHAPVHPSPGAHDDMSDDKGPWAEKLVLTFDGGGIRAISSLLILKRIMHEIREFEIYHEDGPAYSSSSAPWTCPKIGFPRVSEESDRVDEFLPCHYYDYMAGTSTGGLNSIMLGRLRMSVDEAIDNFIKYASAVFDHSSRPYALTPEIEYLSTKAREEIIKIIADSEVGLDMRALQYHDAKNVSQNEPFIPFGENGRRTRTNNDMLGYMWKSFRAFDSKTQPGHSVTIWEVACATSANPNYFAGTEIEGKKYYDGAIVANNPTEWAVNEISDLHRMAPAVLVNLGTGMLTAPTGAPRLIDTKQCYSRREYRRNVVDGILKVYPMELFPESGYYEWRSLDSQLGEKSHRLSVEGHLHSMRYDDWPFTSGKYTLQVITDITNEYLDTDEARERINRIAKEAVRIRRARVWTEQWEDFV